MTHYTGRGYEVVKAGENYYYKWGREAREYLGSRKTANEAGFLSMPVETKYYCIGTSNGKFGEFCKSNSGVIFSVNKAGYAYAKADGAKAEAFIAFIDEFLTAMKNELKLEENDD